MRMSEQQNKQLEWVVRIIMLALLGIASTVGMSVYNKVDEMYAINKVYYEKIMQLEQRDLDQKEQLRDITVDIKKLREDYFQLRNITISN